MPTLYTMFVQELYGATNQLLQGKEVELSQYAEGGKKNSFVTQECAWLYGEQASLFLKVIWSNRDFLQIADDAFFPQYSKIDFQNPYGMRKEIKYSHSCYARNLRRWLNGTVSRKKKCRIEWIALVTCWAAGWSRELCVEQQYVQCREQLTQICRKYNKEIVEQPQTIKQLFVMLWNTSQLVYYESGEEEQGE